MGILVNKSSMEQTISHYPDSSSPARQHPEKAESERIQPFCIAYREGNTGHNRFLNPFESFNEIHCMIMKADVLRCI